MDGLDVRILRKLVSFQAASPVAWDVRRSYSSIANEVGADEGTVRNRIRKLQESGFVSEWRLLVNPRLMGGGDTLVWFDVPPARSKGELLGELRLLEGVFVMIGGYGSFLCVAFRYGRESSRARQIELIRRLARTERVSMGDVPYPDCSIRLDPTDWAVVKAVQREPRKSYRSVAAEVGLSSRTVKRKLDRMLRANAVFGFPAYDPRRLHGSVWALLIVTTRADRTEELGRRLMSEYDDFVWQVTPTVPSVPGEPMTFGYNFLLPNVSTGKEILSAVSKLSSVLTARLELIEETQVTFGSLEEDVERYASGHPTVMATPVRSRS